MNDNKKDLNCQITDTFSVYVIWCRVTGEFYVGVTYQKVQTRIRQHKRGNKQFVDREIKKIGWDNNFDLWTVEENISAESVSFREKKWIKFFNCVYPDGYNKTDGGIGKVTVSADTRTKLRKIALERDYSGEKNPHFGKKHTDEVKSAQSSRMKGKNNPMYGKPPKNKGIPHTEEHKSKISDSLRGEKNPFYGRHHSEKTKNILRDKSIARHAKKTSPK